MILQQLEDKNLSHYSYIVLSDGLMAVVDPGRDPAPYLQFAALHDATLIAIFETHPHADFVSSHLELSALTGGTIYCSNLTGASYPHIAVSDGSVIQVGDLKIKILDTPGHSPDSISLLLHDEEGVPYCLFSGDTLFIGDVGRPDLREKTGTVQQTKEELAMAMFQSLQHKIKPLPPEVLVYPAHGAGTLCGKGMREAPSSTIAEELLTNPALAFTDETLFTEYLLADQPFIPVYFSYNVEMNRNGAPAMQDSIDRIPVVDFGFLNGTNLVVDVRPAAAYRAGHHAGSINLADGLKFETWLGSVILPAEKFYLVAAGEKPLGQMLRRIASIGYEQLILGKSSYMPVADDEISPELELADFISNPGSYTILDVRSESEVRAQPVFASAIHIPLSELRHRYQELPLARPVVVHCQGGYRSAVALSILSSLLPLPVYDLGERVLEFLLSA